MMWGGALSLNPWMRVGAMSTAFPPQHATGHLDVGRGVSAFKLLGL